MFDLPYPECWRDWGSQFGVIGVVAALLVGATIGSFLNVVIYRIPRGMGVNRPKRSFCPQCGYGIPWYHNLPLVSWLVLRGRCAKCGGKISVRYWLVEAGVALLFAAIWLEYPPVAAVLLMAWAAYAVATSLVDYDHMLVFPSLTWPAAGIGVLLAWSAPGMYFETTVSGAIVQSLIGIAGGYAIIRVIIELGKLAFGKWKREFATPAHWELKEPQTDDEELAFLLDGEEILWGDIFARVKTDRIEVTGGTLILDGKSVAGSDFKIFHDRIEAEGQSYSIEGLKSASGTAMRVVIPREAMGQGDADIMAMIGAVGGWPILVFSLFAGSVIGMVSGVAGRLSPSARIPFGPCLLGGALIWLFGGYKIWLWYTGLMP